ncbi:MAG: tryptophan synthase subunit alpha [Bacteroidales bacterium]|jgi:tryptophan synthase alpha chain|nr:tryptophan synthase subunit alpha [Bacteroidales bacterium]
MNRILSLFERKPSGVLSVYMTAGFPQPDDTLEVICALEEQGADMIEIGIPFSDPMADGPVIQHSSSVALNNGMTLKKLFAQLEDVRSKAALPLVMMGYLNPVMQYGVENFCRHCAAVGVDGVIIPDLPFDEYLREYKPLADKYGLCFIMLITPETSADRIRLIDEHTDGFIYMVSTASTTGAKDAFDDKTIAYFRRINTMGLKHPRLIGFGISNRATCEAAMAYAGGAIVGSSFIQALMQNGDIRRAVTETFSRLGYPRNAV